MLRRAAGYMERKRYLECRTAAIGIQRYSRGWRVRQQNKVANEAATTIQAIARGRMERHNLQQTHSQV